MIYMLTCRYAEGEQMDIKGLCLETGTRFMILMCEYVLVCVCVLYNIY